MRLLSVLSTLALLAGGTGCGDDDGTVDPGTDAGPGTDDAGHETDAGTDTDGGAGGVPDTYSFDSRFVDGESSVSYGGQIARIILVEDLVGEMERISEGVLDGSLDATTVDEAGEVTARLNAFVRDGTADLGTRALPSLTAEGDDLCQSTYEDLSDKDLIGKLAGQDALTDHQDWSTAFVGWEATDGLTVPTGVSTPVNLLDTFIATFEAQVIACVLDVDACPASPGGDALPLYVTPQGHDLVQLIEKFLLSAVNFSQGTDDYLDDDIEDKGILVQNSEQDDGAPYTSLEHHWDEGYGYFGAARNYNDYTDEEIRAAGGRPEYENGYNDWDGDGCIDVMSEYNFAASTNAAKRDDGSTSMTDYTQEIFDAWITGRHIIASAGGDLNDDQLADLQTQRDIIVSVWEKALAATVVHYINDTIADMGDCGTDAYSFTDHAKHWSEMKGFALAFQFNPRSPWNTDAHDYAALHELLDDAPILCAGDTSAYETDLLAARDAIQAAYGFAEEDVAAW